MELIDAPKTLYKDIFASNQPFRSLYTIHALGEYVKQARPKSSSDSVVSAEDRASHTTTIGRALKFLVQALEDDEIAPNASSQIQTKIEHVLTMAITRLLDGMFATPVEVKEDGTNPDIQKQAHMEMGPYSKPSPHLQPLVFCPF